MANVYAEKKWVDILPAENREEAQRIYGAYYEPSNQEYLDVRPFFFSRACEVRAGLFQKNFFLIFLNAQEVLVCSG